MTAVATASQTVKTNGVTAPATPAPPATSAAPPPTAAPPSAEATPAAAPSSAEPPKPRIDPQLEAQYRARERKLQEERAAFRRDQEAWQAQQAQRAPLEQQLAQDPIAVLARVWGVDRAVAEQHLGGRLLNKGQPQPSEELAQLRQQVQALTTTLQERDRREQATVRQQTLERELDRFVETARDCKDTHPWVADATASDPKRVRSHCLRIAREDPSLTDAEILDRIEDELSFAGKLRRDSTSPPATSPPGTDTTPPAPTLTNHTASQQSGLGSPRSILRMSPDERLQAGIAAIRAARAKQAAK
jgi:hypothetical protein